MKTNILVAISSAVIGGFVGAGAFALLEGDDTAQRGTVIRFGASFSDIETMPFCVDAQKFCLVKLDSGEYRALYTYDTHDWSRGRNCDITWRPEMLFIDPDTQVQSQAGFAPPAAARPIGISASVSSGRAAAIWTSSPSS